MTGCERRNVLVVEGELVAAWRSLDPSPVERLTYEAGAGRPQPVEVVAAVGSGLSERVFGNQSQEGTIRTLIGVGLAAGAPAQRRKHREARGKRGGAGERAPSPTPHGGSDAARPATAARRSRAL